jgi:hypothetical protein
MILPSTTPSSTTGTPSNQMMVYPIPFLNGTYTIPTPSSISNIFNIPVALEPNKLTVLSSSSSPSSSSTQQSPPAMITAPPVPTLEQEQNLWIIASNDKATSSDNFTNDNTTPEAVASKKVKEDAEKEVRRRGERGGNMAHCA